MQRDGKISQEGEYALSEQIIDGTDTEGKLLTRNLECDIQGELYDYIFDFKDGWLYPTPYPNSSDKDAIICSVG